MTKSVLLAIGAVSCVIGCSSSTSTGGVTGNDPTIGVDGTWDITSSGQDAIGASQMTVSHGSITGYVAASDEGMMDAAHAGCKKTFDRTEFTFTVQASSLSASFVDHEEWAGASCPAAVMSTFDTFSGTRAASGPDSFTQLNGTWNVTEKSDPPFVVLVDGVNASAWASDADRTAMKPATITINVANGMATVMTSNKSLTFAAKRR